MPRPIKTQFEENLKGHLVTPSAPSGGKLGFQWASTSLWSDVHRPIHYAHGQNVPGSINKRLDTNFVVAPT
jgi:hypothetical protein